MSVLRKVQKEFNISVKNLTQEKLVRFFAWTGNKSGTVKSDREGYIYVTDYNGRTYTVFNQVVPLIADRFVEVGQKRKSSVLEIIREVEAYPTQKTVNTPNHSKNHEWASHDVLWVRQEQFFGGGLAIPEANTMTIVFTGFVYRLNGFHLLANQTLDLSSYVPDEGAFYLLVQVDENKVISYVEGAAVDSRELLEYEDIPEQEDGKLELFAVKMYAGQTQIIKARADTDVIDLRWARQNGGGGTGGQDVTQVDSSSGTSDTYGVLSGAINGVNKVFTVSLASYVSGGLKVWINGQLLTQGSSEDWIELVPASGTFEMAEAPVSGDVLIAEYKHSSGATGDADTLDGYEASAFLRTASIGAGTEEFDFGSAGDAFVLKTIINALVTSSSKIVATINCKATANNSVDDILIQDLAVKIGSKSTGQFDISVESLLGPFLYEVNVDYLIYY